MDIYYKLYDYKFTVKKFCCRQFENDICPYLFLKDIKMSRGERELMLDLGADEYNVYSHFNYCPICGDKINLIPLEKGE